MSSSFITIWKELVFSLLVIGLLFKKRFIFYRLRAVFIVLLRNLIPNQGRRNRREGGRGATTPPDFCRYNVNPRPISMRSVADYIRHINISLPRISRPSYGPATTEVAYTRKPVEIRGTFDIWPNQFLQKLVSC